MNTSIHVARQALASQPFSQLLNSEVVTFGSGSAELRLPITEQLRQQHGFVHGGVISYAADNALTFAGGSAHGPAVVTSEFKINYVRPALGEQVVARASVLHAGKSQAVCRCEVYCVSAGVESLCAVAQGTIVSVSPGSNNTPNPSLQSPCCDASNVAAPAMFNHALVVRVCLTSPACSSSFPSRFVNEQQQGDNVSVFYAECLAAEH